MATKEIKSIELVNGESKFTVFISPFTSGRMDKAQSLLGGNAKEKIAGYYDLENVVNNVYQNCINLPDILDSDPSMEAVKPLFEKYFAEKITESELKEKLTTAFKQHFTLETKARNTVILRSLVRSMCLTSQLTPEQITLIQSDVNEEFWSEQDAYLMRDTGEFFRSKVLEYSR